MNIILSISFNNKDKQYQYLLEDPNANIQVGQKYKMLVDTNYYGRTSEWVTVQNKAESDTLPMIITSSISVVKNKILKTTKLSSTQLLSLRSSKTEEKSKTLPPIYHCLIGKSMVTVRYYDLCKQEIQHNILCKQQPDIWYIETFKEQINNLIELLTTFDCSKLFDVTHPITLNTLEQDKKWIEKIYR